MDHGYSRKTSCVDGFGMNELIDTRGHMIRWVQNRIRGIISTMLKLLHRYQFVRLRFNGFAKSLRQSHSKTQWSQYFDNLQSEIFKNKISRQKPSNLKFVQYENIFAYHVIKSNNNGDNDATHDSCLISNHFKGDIDQLFDSQGAKNMDDKIQSIRTMNLDEIINLLKVLFNSLPLFLDENEWNRAFLQSSFSKIWQELDSKLCQNLEKEWEHQKSKFLIASQLWFALGLGSSVQFNSKMIDKILEDDQFEKDTLLHLMFHLNLFRTICPHKHKTIIDKTQSFLERNSNPLNLDELSVIGSGFFKTQTKMPLDMLKKYIELCTGELLKKYEIKSTISIAAILKIIRFSFETIMFHPKQLRPQMNLFIETLGCHGSNLMDSEICLTHLILMLNAALIIEKNLYRQVLKKLTGNLNDFRIKDIERILFCYANARFLCPIEELEKLEQYLLESEESKIYPYHVFNIILYLFIIDYHPDKLIRFSCNEEFLQNALDSSKVSMNSSLLMLDTIFRLQKPNINLLNPEKISQFKSSINGNPSHSMKGRFLKLIVDSLLPHYGDRFQMIHLFPFANHPFAVLLDVRKLDQIKKKNRNHSTSYKNFVPFSIEYLKPNHFQNCFAILPLLEKDFIQGSTVRGMVHVIQTLLRDLGFQVIPVRQIFFREFLLKPDQYQTNLNDQNLGKEKMRAMIDKFVVPKQTDRHKRNKQKAKNKNKQS